MPPLDLASLLLMSQWSWLSPAHFQALPLGAGCEDSEEGEEQKGGRLGEQPPACSLLVSYSLKLNACFPGPGLQTGKLFDSKEY